MRPAIIYGPNRQLISSDGRGGGKTFQMVKWLKEDKTNRFLIVCAATTKTSLLTEYGLQSMKNHIFTLEDIVQGRARGVRGEFGIDDADSALQHFLGGIDVKALSITT